jgi:hypothetical protein
MWTVSVAQSLLNNVAGKHNSDRGWCGWVYGIPNEPKSLLISSKYQYLGREGGCLFPSPYKLLLDCTTSHPRKYYHILVARHVVCIDNWMY